MWDIVIIAPPSTKLAEQISGLEQLLAIHILKRGSGEFDGNCVGVDTGQVELYFRTKKRGHFLRDVQSFLVLHDAVRNIYALLTLEGEGETRIEFDSKRSIDQQLKAGRPRGARTRKVELYDYYAVPLSSGEFGYVQFITTCLPTGDFVQTLQLRTREIAPLEAVLHSAPLFPPVAIHVAHAVREGKWQFVGNRVPERPVRLPLMRHIFTNTPGTYDHWHLKDTEEGTLTLIGRLTEENYNLEVMHCWGAAELAVRIDTGINRLDGLR